MKTVGNDLIYRDLQSLRKWYLVFGSLLVIFAVILLGSLSVTTLSIIFLFGALMMLGGLLHLVAAFKFFTGSSRWCWALFGIIYLAAGFYAFKTPITTAIVLTGLLAISLIIAGVFRTVTAFIIKPQVGWGWTLFSGFITFITGLLILISPNAPFWVLGLFLAGDILFQGVNYLTLASAIKFTPPSV